MPSAGLATLASAAQDDVVLLRLAPLAEDEHVLRPPDLTRLGLDAVGRVAEEPPENEGAVLALHLLEPRLLTRLEELREEVDEAAELGRRDVERELVRSRRED